MTDLRRFDRAFDAISDNRNEYKVSGVNSAPDLCVWAKLERDPGYMARVPTIGYVATQNTSGLTALSTRIDLHRQTGLITVSHFIGMPGPEGSHDIIWSNAGGIARPDRPEFVEFGLRAIEAALSSIMAPVTR